MKAPHAWFEVRFVYGTHIECECGFQPFSQAQMDAHEGLNA